MTVKHFSLGIGLVILGIFIGTAQTLLVNAFPTEFQKPPVAPIPTRDIVVPSATPTASPSATPIPTLTPRTVIRHYYYTSPTPTI